MISDFVHNKSNIFFIKSKYQQKKTTPPKQMFCLINKKRPGNHPQPQTFNQPIKEGSNKDKMFH